MRKPLLLTAVIIALFSVFLLIYLNKNKLSWKNSKPPNKSIIFLGDSGTGNNRQIQVAKSIKEYCKKNRCLEGVILGDVIYDFGVKNINDEQFQSKFEKHYKDLNFPFNIIFGNHDYLGCRDCYVEYSSKLWRMPSYYYKRSIEDMDLFFIDTENFDLEQQKWLENSLKQSKSKLKLVSGHRPIFTFEVAHSGEEWSGKNELNSILCRNKVNIYFSGHSHLLEYIDNKNTCGFKQVISGSGGAEARKIKSNSIDKFFLEQNGFVALEILKDNRHILKFIDINNTVKYTVAL